jgi:hypothetical protein
MGARVKMQSSGCVCKTTPEVYSVSDEKLLRILSQYEVETHIYQYPPTLDIKRSSDSKQLPSLSCPYISVLATSMDNPEHDVFQNRLNGKMHP